MQTQDSRLLRGDGTEVARVVQGIVRFPVSATDDSIEFYRSVGGAHFHERSTVPFAMSSLDTPIYHGWINDVLPKETSEIVIDIGGGDGRHALHCLSHGCRRVVVVDAAAEALVRFRERVAQQNRDWLDRLLLIEADARALPLASASAACVIAIETLYYLNEDFEIGLKECVRLLSPSAKILISERDYEAGLVLRLLYHGLDGMMQVAHNRSLWDGPDNSQVRSRCFTQSELIDICSAAGLRLRRVGGTSLLALLLGYLHGRKMLGAHENNKLPAVANLLLTLSRDGSLRRCHVIIADRGEGDN